MFNIFSSSLASPDMIVGSKVKPKGCRRRLNNERIDVQGERKA
jgi:hypothetical protein